MKVVPDPNVLLSAVIAPGGTSDQALRVAMTSAQMVVSRHLVERFLVRASDEKFRRWFTMADASALAERLWDFAEIVADPVRVPRVVKGDPSDDYLVELARAHRDAPDRGPRHPRIATRTGW